MMKERVKTAALIAMVVVSVILSLSLMVERATPADSIVEANIDFGPSPKFSTVITPTRVHIVNSERMALVKTNSDLYRELVEGLAKIEFKPLESWEMWEQVEVMLEDNIDSGILFRYDYSLTSDMLAGYMENYDQADFPFEGINLIFVKADGRLLFMDSSDSEGWQLNARFDSEALLKALSADEGLWAFNWGLLTEGENYLANGLVFDLVSVGGLSVPGWESMEIDSEAIINSFFVEPGRVTMIRETDGAIIYTDGIQALRIFPSGALEFNIALEPRTGAFLRSDNVQTAIDFSTRHGGWPIPMTLGRLQPRQDQVALEFVSLDGGLPLHGPTANLVFTVSGPAVINYWRNVILTNQDRVHEIVDIRPFSRLLLESNQASDWFSRNPSTIRDLSLVLYWTGESLRPAWRVSLQRQELYFGATDGQLLFDSSGGGN